MSTMGGCVDVTSLGGQYLDQLVFKVNCLDNVKMYIDKYKHVYVYIHIHICIYSHIFIYMYQ